MGMRRSGSPALCSGGYEPTAVASPLTRRIASGDLCTARRSRHERLLRCAPAQRLVPHAPDALPAVPNRGLAGARIRGVPVGVPVVGIPGIPLRLPAASPRIPTRIPAAGGRFPPPPIRHYPGPLYCSRVGGPPPF